jgi:hypothetical protein
MQPWAGKAGQCRRNWQMSKENIALAFRVPLQLGIGGTASSTER